MNFLCGLPPKEEDAKKHLREIFLKLIQFHALLDPESQKLNPSARMSIMQMNFPKPNPYSINTINMLEVDMLFTRKFYRKIEMRNYLLNKIDMAHLKPHDTTKKYYPHVETYAEYNRYYCIPSYQKNGYKLGPPLKKRNEWRFPRYTLRKVYMEQKDVSTRNVIDTPYTYDIKPMHDFVIFGPDKKEINKSPFI